MGSIMQKIMGPLMTAGGAGAMVIPGGQAFAAPLLMGGLGQMMQQGGALGPSTPSLTPPAPTQTATAAPMISPSVPGTAGQGLSSFTPNVGPSTDVGSSAAGSMGYDVASNLLSAANPFAQWAVT